MKYYQMDFMGINNSAIEDNSIDLIISSVPLEILDNRIGRLFAVFKRILAPGGHIVIDAPAGRRDRLSDVLEQVGAAVELYLVQIQFVLDMYPESNQHLYLHHWESTFPFTGDWALDPKREMGHVCEFDADLISEIIETLSSKGDTVLDPFCGTGTVPGEAEKMGRKGIACDLRPAENIKEDYRTYTLIGAGDRGSTS